MDAQFLAAPQLSQDGGTIDIGAPVTASAAIGTIYYTTDGTDPRLPGGGLSPTAVAMGAQTSENVLIPTGANWQYLDSGNEPGDRVAHGEPTILPTPIRKPPPISTRCSPPRNSGSTGRRSSATATATRPPSSVTAPIRTTSTSPPTSATASDWSENSAITSLTLRLLCDDGAVVYLNGYEVARYNMPTGTISYTTPASSAIDGDGGIRSTTSS